MSDDRANPKGYVIFLSPPPEPGSAGVRAIYDCIRKFDASVDSIQNVASESLDTRTTSHGPTSSQMQHEGLLSTRNLSSLSSSNSTTLPPRPGPLRIPIPETDASGVGTLSVNSNSASDSDSASPTSAPADGVGSASEISDAELSPTCAEASHRFFNMPSYMPLPNPGGSASAMGSHGAVPDSNLPGYHVSYALSGRGLGMKHQIFAIMMKIDQDIPPYMAETHTKDRLPSFRLLFDPAYSTILTIGSHCQMLKIPDGSKLTLPLNPQYLCQEAGIIAHAKILVHPHSPASGLVVPATVQLSNVYYGSTTFLNGCSAVATLTERVYQLKFLNCHQWDKISWDSSLHISCPIAVAYCATSDPSLTVDGNVDGIIGFAPTDHQTIFHLSSPLQAPSALASLEGTPLLSSVENSDGGIIVYCALRPFALRIPNKNTGLSSLKVNPFNSWIAFNKWPIRRPNQPDSASTPEWSQKIKIFELDADLPTWNILLLSIKFLKYDVNSQTWADIPNGEIVFEGGLVTVLDPGCSVSWVPPEIVSCIRTALFPCPHNENLERVRGDRPHVQSDFGDRNNPTPLQDLNYAVAPSKVQPKLCNIEYRFSNGPGKAVVVVRGPVANFICAYNPSPPNNRRSEYEGLLFVPPPGKIPTEGRGAIFGLNFFQSMFVALHKPSNKNRKPYVELFPQWYQDIPKYGPPPHPDDDDDSDDDKLDDDA